MPLSCRKALVLAVVLTAACREVTAPPIIGSFSLASINGHPLPAHIQAQGGDTITVLSSSLTLDAAGKARIFEHIRYVHPNSPPGESIYTSVYDYEITGDPTAGQTVTFTYSPPCPPNALCIAPPVGTLVGSILTLTYGEYPGARPPSVYWSRLPD
jgi:hypothetical protein